MGSPIIGSKKVVKAPIPKFKPKSTGTRTLTMKSMSGKTRTITTPKFVGDEIIVYPMGNRSGAGLLGPAGKSVNKVYKTY